MAETPKGDTASPTAAADLSAADGPDRLEAESIEGADLSPPAPDAPPAPDMLSGGTIAGDAGRDSLTRADGSDAASPWSPARPAQTLDSGPGSDREPATAADLVRDATEDDEPVAVGSPGGLRRSLILVILLALVVGGGYASYPMWRAGVEPLARQFGIALPAVETAQAPAATEPAPAPQAAAPAQPTEPTPAPPAPSPSSPSPSSPAPTSTAPTSPAPTSPPVAAAPVPEQSPNPPPKPPVTVADPALAGDVDRLKDRTDALEQRLTAIEDRDPGAPKADAAAVERLESRLDGMAQTLTAVTDEVAIVREGLATSGGGEGLGPMAAQLSERLQGLTDRMEALERTAHPAPPAPTEPAVKPEDIAGVQAGIDRVSADLDSAVGRIANLDDAVGKIAGLDDEVRTNGEIGTALAARLDAVDQRLDRIAKALESTRSGRERAGAFLLAANQLAAAATGSGSFAPEIEALRAAAPADDTVMAALETLAGHAGGVPSLAVLRRGFSQAAANAVDASVVGSGDGVVGQALTRVAALVTIRRTETADGDGLDALLLRAETALAGGDLEGAIEAVRKLDGDPVKAVAGWLADAEARAAVDAAARTLQARALAGVAGG